MSRGDSALILELVVTKDDITLAEIKAGLAKRGVSVGMGTLWCFFDRHKIIHLHLPKLGIWQFTANIVSE